MLYDKGYIARKLWTIPIAMGMFGLGQLINQPPNQVTVTATDTVTIEQSYEPIMAYACTDEGHGVFVRSEPSTTSDKLGGIPENQLVAVLAVTYNNWGLIYTEQYDYTLRQLKPVQGFVNLEYLCQIEGH